MLKAADLSPDGDVGSYNAEHWLGYMVTSDHNE